MATDIERLVVQMDAKITGLQNGVNRAMGLTTRMHKSMEASNKRLATSFRNVASSIAVMHGPLGGIASRFSSTASIFNRTGLALGALTLAAGGAAFTFGKMLNIATQAIAEFDKLGKAARTVGLSSDLYQSLGFAALEEGVDGLENALEQFTVRSGQLATGQGELYSYFSRTNEAILEQLHLASSQEERLRIVADAVRSATSAEEKAAIARAAFGRSGVDMVRILKDGADGLDDFTRRAREMGLVVDREIIARSEEMNNQLGVAQRIIDNQLKQAFIDLAPVVIAAAQAIGTVATAIASVVDEMRSLEDMTSRGLERRLAQLQDELANAPPDGDWVTGLDGQRVDLNQNIRDEIMRITAELAARSARYRAPDIPNLPGDDTPPSTTTGSRSSPFLNAMQSLNDRIEMVKAETAAMREVNPLINDYGYALEYARARQQLLNAAKKEGLAITPELSRSIDDMATAMAEATVEAAQLAEQQDDLRRSWEEWRDVSRNAMRSFIDDMVEGKSATEALSSAVQQLANHLINLGLNSLFGSGSGDFGLFGQLFNLPGKSSGGYTGPGGKHQPAGIVHKGEYVFSKEATQRAGVGNLEAMHRSLQGYANGGLVGGLTLPAVPPAANSNTPAITYAPQIDARGADVDAVARLEQAMARDRAEFEGRVKRIVGRRQKDMW